MTGAKVRVRSHVGGDTLTLTVSGDTAELERGLQLAYALLTDPVLEAAALEQWKDAETQRIVERKSQPMQVLMDTSMAAFYPPGETRPKSLTAEQVRALARPAAQAWLKHLITDAPIEVAVVGDVDRETATRLVARYVGALPRGRASATRHSPIYGPSPDRRGRSAWASRSTPSPRRPRCSPASLAPTCATSVTRDCSTWPRACSAPGC